MTMYGAVTEPDAAIESDDRTVAIMTVEDAFAERLDAPEFAVAMRGYDRGQVGDYITRLREFLADAEQRAATAQAQIAHLRARNDELQRELADERSQLPTARYDGVGHRIDEILQLARAEADALVRSAREQGDRLLESSRQQISREQDAAEAGLAGVSARRDAVLAEIRRLRDLLTDADGAVIDLTEPAENHPA